MPQIAENPSVYTYDDYRRETGERRCELIDGQIYYLAAPTKEHQAISAVLCGKLYNHLQNAKCRVYPAPYDVIFGTEYNIDPTVQPDLSVVCKGKRFPTVIVEILSFWTKSKQKRDKFELYEKNGIEEYWELNPSSRSVTVYKLTDGKYTGEEKREGVFASEAIGYSEDVEAFYDAVDDYLENS